jgi:hypothetical protein
VPFSLRQLLHLFRESTEISKSPSSTSLPPGTFSSPSSASPAYYLLLRRNSSRANCFLYTLWLDLSVELQACLKEFTAEGAIEIRENGGRLAPFSGLRWEVRGAAEKPLLHLWSENHNLTRRVLAITDHSDQRLALAVERFGRAKPDRLEFIRLEFERAQRDLSRKAFCDGLGHLLAEQFPDETVESLTASPDLEHSISGSYVRGILHRGSSCFALLAVPHGESGDTVEGSLTFALLWLDRARNSARRGTINALRLIFRGAVRDIWPRAPLPFMPSRNSAKSCCAFEVSRLPVGTTDESFSVVRIRAKNSMLRPCPL